MASMTWTACFDSGRMASATAMMPLTSPSTATNMGVLPRSESSLAFVSNPLRAYSFSRIRARLPRVTTEPLTLASMPWPGRA